MATQSTVTGPVQTPSGSTPTMGYVRFQLGNWNSQSGTVITTSKVEVPIDIDTQDFSASLWATTVGDRSSTYKVTAVWYYSTTGVWVEDELGYCQVGTSGPYALGDILVDDIPVETVMEYATEAALSASEAAASAASADFLTYDYYNADSILGTVSQSGGVPTGAVIEYGSNANGEYIRYADGTQICWAIGETLSKFSYTRCRLLWTFPASFSDAPSTTANLDPSSATVYGADSADRINWGYVGTLNNTSSSVYIDAYKAYSAPSIDDLSEVDVNIVSVGRWY